MKEIHLDEKVYTYIMNFCYFVLVQGVDISFNLYSNPIETYERDSFRQNC